MQDHLKRGLAALGLTPPPTALDQLQLYYTRLVEQNKHMNLTAITEPQRVAELHFLDSAALLAQQPLAGYSLIDVGTGAGFPGVVLKILQPDLQLCLLDSLQKRLIWLEALCQELGLTGLRFVHGRAEELGHAPDLREQFDFATARAVASLPLLCELCLPFVRKGGQFLAMKAERGEEELQKALPLLHTMGGGEVTLCDYALPESSVRRCLVRVEKNLPCPANYPRKWSKIKPKGQS